MNESNATAAPSDPAALTRHIETHYHAGHREALPGLSERAHRVERVHEGVPGVPAGLGDLLDTFAARLSAHMAHEEETVFPAIRAGKPLGAVEARALQAEHAANVEAIAAIRRLTGDITLPAGACRTWTALYDGLGAFVTDLEAHMRLEEEALFAGEAHHG